ncbi:MAG: ABC transporter permease [Acidobacteriota bacterium]|nr:ABC transporter permease [Acidobacteriota bacterium]
MINWLLQTVSVTRFSLQTLPERKGSALSSVFGIAGVVAVLVGVLSIAQGIRLMVQNSADPDNAIVMRSGSDSEMMSGLGGTQAEVITDAPGIARDAEGALASPELFVIINLPKRSTGTDANVPLRGVSRPAFKVRSNLEVVQGRPFEWGLAELVVGAGAAREFAGLDLGSSIEVGGEQWPIVGIFEAGGGIAEGEIWADAAVVQSAYRRGNSYQSVYTKLASSGSFTEFKDSLTADPRLNVKVERAADFYSDQSTVLRGIIVGLGSLIAALMGLGAMFGALNTMYTAVSARTREIATLRALGFKSGPVVVSVLFESLLLALVGGLIGGGLAYLAFDGFRAATINFQSFSQIAFAFDVNATLLKNGIVYALLIGLVGGLFPAIRAARLPVATALRES